jgi:hypothetical protein
MRYIFAILLFTSCGKKTEIVEVYSVDTLLIQSANRTDTISELIPKVDHVIHEEEKRIKNDLKSLKIELNEAKTIQNKTKLIYIHDTIVIREKTNFWGRKRVSTDSMQSIDSTEYEKNY